MYLAKKVTLNEVLDHFKSMFDAVDNFRAKYRAKLILKYDVSEEFRANLRPVINEHEEMINYLLSHPTCDITHNQAALIEELDALLDEQLTALDFGNVDPVECTLHNYSHPLGYTRFSVHQYSV